MIAKNGHGAVAQTDDAPQGVERVGAAVDQVAGKPELGIRVAGEIRMRQQLDKR
jgi:hypothetical protein